ncbi:hypothetical protein [Anaeropeptidivorans aminofermentans]|jgi:uncharacterized protein YuzE|uniref:hypothetical protein n=1 Tax=Anaeropeptidivorans aminofermentans TaxID=2934315 RepID=UPI002024DC1A|nr:hypothetical protein [Anaeropeptidivorans aminofermentans]MBE6011384.1 hypothetical protein [Lachnospiraceae bacterium]
MPDYEKMYFELFNAVTSAIATLEDAQKMCEEIYIETGDHGKIILLESQNKEHNEPNKDS